MTFGSKMTHEEKLSWLKNTTRTIIYSREIWAKICVVINVFSANKIRTLTMPYPPLTHQLWNILTWLKRSKVFLRFKLLLNKVSAGKPLLDLVNLGYAQLVRQLFRLLLFNNGPTPADFLSWRSSKILNMILIWYENFELNDKINLAILLSKNP